MNVCVKIADLQDLVAFATKINDRDIIANPLWALYDLLAQSTDIESFIQIVNNPSIAIDLVKLFEHSIKAENISQFEYLAKMFMDQDKYVDYRDVSELALLYESSKSQIIKDYIVFYINKSAINGRMKVKKVPIDALRFNPLIELLSKQHIDFVKEIILQIDDPILFIKDDALGGNEEKYRTILKNIYNNAAVVDTALGLRQTNLPPEVVEQIINDAYNTRSTMGLYETMEHIEPIINPTPGITKAGRHESYKDAYLNAKKYDDADEDESDVTEDEVDKDDEESDGESKKKAIY